MSMNADRFAKEISPMRPSLENMARRLSLLLGEEPLSFCLYGSVALNDFRLGWSDIDMLCLTRRPISEEQAHSLVHLRQTLSEEEPGNPYYRLFEGCIASWDELSAGRFTRLVYWGTSGERVTDRYSLDAFSRYQLTHGSVILLYGQEAASALSSPAFSELMDGIIRHKETIRTYARETSPDIHSCGWLLDIARCIYTLRTGTVSAKTFAGEWALSKNLCPVRESLKKALIARQAPLRYRDDLSFQEWCGALGPDIQRFADVLEAEIARIHA